jgi:hypothetical protein
MGKLRQILIVNAATLFVCSLLLAIVPGARTPAVWLVAVLLSLGLVNTTYWLLPHLVESKIPQQGQAILTLVLLLLAGIISWVWIRR